MTFLGADTDQVRDHGERIRSGGRRLEELIQAVDGTVRSVEWIGADADAFLQLWESQVRNRGAEACERLEQRAVLLEEEADGQDTCSDDGSSGGSGERGGGGGRTPWDVFGEWLEDYEPKESDGFFGDLLGGPESGMLGNIAWNSLGAGVDVTSMIPGIGLPGTIAGLAMDIPSIGIGMYDMAQSFQDGELFGTMDGAVTAGINTLDTAAGILSVIPYTAPVGEVAGIFTSGADALWSGATVAAQLDAINGGDHGGSTSRFLLEQAGVDTGALDYADDLFGRGSEAVRDAVPIIDPMIDSSQLAVEAIIPQGAQQMIEGGATVVNDALDSVLPW